VRGVLQRRVKEKDLWCGCSADGCGYDCGHCWAPLLVWVD
jgi:hypothetical protein